MKMPFGLFQDIGIWQAKQQQYDESIEYSFLLHHFGTTIKSPVQELQLFSGLVDGQCSNVLM
jgi:hypothetical protein